MIAIENTRSFNSYKSLFKINYKIYDIGGKVLPRAVPLDALIITVVLFFPILPLGYLFYPSHPWVLSAALASGASWLLTQMDPQGKFMPIFIVDILSYFARPKKVNLAGITIVSTRKHFLQWNVPEVDTD